MPARTRTRSGTRPASRGAAALSAPVQQVERATQVTRQDRVISTVYVVMAALVIGFLSTTLALGLFEV
jgi:hypothetical protein